MNETNGLQGHSLQFHRIQQNGPIIPQATVAMMMESAQKNRMVTIGNMAFTQTEQQDGQEDKVPMQ